MNKVRILALSLGIMLAACSGRASEDPVDTTLPNDTEALSLNDTSNVVDMNVADESMNDTMTAPEPLSELGIAPSNASSYDDVSRKTDDDVGNAM